MLWMTKWSVGGPFSRPKPAIQSMAYIRAEVLEKKEQMAKVVVQQDADGKSVAARGIESGGDNLRCCCASHT